MSEIEDWTNIYNQSFTQEEVREAIDFRDISEMWNLQEIEEDFLTDLLKENLSVGKRLYLAMYLPFEKLGYMMLMETDKRLTHIIKRRCEDNKIKEDGRSKIILPGERS